MGASVFWTPTLAPQERILTTTGGTYPAMAPDGKSVLYSRGAGTDLDLYRLDLTTGVATRLTTGPEEDSAARWSPDGQRIVFQRQDMTGQRDIWQLDLHRGSPQNLTRTADCDEQHPSFTPDGAGIVFDSNCAIPALGESMASADNYEIHLRAIADPGVTRLTTWPDWDMYGSLNAAGTHLAWRRATRNSASADRNFEILIMELATGSVVNVSRHPAAETSPAWSPDGQWLVFASLRHGASELFVVRADGSRIQRLTTTEVGRSGYDRPSFGSDSIVLASRRRGEHHEIVAIALPQELQRPSTAATP
jgi:Tol biopolymer transport system component